MKRKYENEEQRLKARRAQRRVYYQRHSEKVKAYNKQYHNKHREALIAKASQRAPAYHLKRTYGLTVTDYDNMLNTQNGVCAICGPNVKNHNRRHLCVDHNHTTGQIRGLLCDRCNRLIGLADEHPLILKSASRYIDTWSGRFSL